VPDYVRSVNISDFTQRKVARRRRYLKIDHDAPCTPIANDASLLADPADRMNAVKETTYLVGRELLDFVGL